MKVLRTPDERFANLPGFSFAPHYVEIPDGEGGTLRVHHLDEGPRDGKVVLLMHGNPSWSYLWRKMIPPIVAAGYRCIAPDLVGLGRSDKPAGLGDYTVARHVEWMRAALFDRLDLRDVNLVCQDWGGVIGLRLVAEHPGRFRSVVTANTGLPTGQTPVSEDLRKWPEFARSLPEFNVGQLVSMGCTKGLSPEEIAAYDAPFPDESYKSAARSFPGLIPMTPDDPAVPDQLRAWESLDRFERPVLCAFSDKDPFNRGGNKAIEKRVPGALGQPHTTIHGGGHFLQEDCGAELAKVVIDFLATRV
ncbi:MAG: haloalkane dehalogenase [Alphaproteobacteria bacterium]